MTVEEEIERNYIILCSFCGVPLELSAEGSKEEDCLNIYGTIELCDCDAYIDAQKETT